MAISCKSQITGYPHKAYSLGRGEQGHTRAWTCKSRHEQTNADRIQNFFILGFGLVS